MRPVYVTVGPLTTADADGIAQSQTPTAAAGVTLNGALVTGGIAYLAQARRVLFTFAADETGHTFTVTGTNWEGVPISETVAGTTAGTVYTDQDYLTVTAIAISANATGALTVGTNGIASTPPVVFDVYARSTPGFQCTVTGTVNYTVQQTIVSPWDVEPEDWVWVNHPDTANLVAATATAQGNYAYGPPSMMRVVINSGTGSVALAVNQPGIIG